MLLKMALKLTEYSPLFRRLMWRQWYQYLAGYQVSDWRFMNYGYASLDSAEPRLELDAADEPDRFAIQLYHRVARAVPLAGCDVLEVGCGRGGGSSFVQRYHQPRQMTGVDFSAKAIRFCRQTHKLAGLSFESGDAEALPFADASFDAVLNVESSHCYGSMPNFLREARRVLRPGGHFLFADLRAAADRPRLHEQIVANGMTIVEEQEITPHVVEALRQDSQRKLSLIRQHASRPLESTVQEFAAVEGSGVFTGFQNGATVYLRYVLKK